VAVKTRSINYGQIRHAQDDVIIRKILEPIIFNDIFRAFPLLKAQNETAMGIRIEK
jgi:hypothetical protein